MVRFTNGEKTFSYSIEDVDGFVETLKKQLPEPMLDFDYEKLPIYSLKVREKVPYTQLMRYSHKFGVPLFPEEFDYEIKTNQFHTQPSLQTAFVQPLNQAIKDVYVIAVSR